VIEVQCLEKNKYDGNYMINPGAVTDEKIQYLIEQLAQVIGRGGYMKHHRFYK
jgi:hypothetical protein